MMTQSTFEGDLGGLNSPQMSATPLGTPSGTEDHIDLGKNYNSDWNMWSNRPQDMQIAAYFSPATQTVSLGVSYNLPALKPVLVKPDLDIGNTYLLADNEGGYYIWSEASAEMWKFVNQDLALLDIVELVTKNTYASSDLVRQFERGVKAWTDNRSEDDSTSADKKDVTLDDKFAGGDEMNEVSVF